MNSDLIQALQTEIEKLDKEIETATKKRRIVSDVIDTYSVYSGSHPEPVKAVSDKLPVKVFVKRKYAKRNVPERTGKELNGGKVKFNTFVFNILKNSPDKKFTPKELTVSANEAISKNLILTVPSKDIRSAVSTSLWSFINAGKALKHDDGSYQYNSENNTMLDKSEPAPKETGKTISTDTNSLEEAILDVLNLQGQKASTVTAICTKIRLSSNFLEISKNLNGTLFNSIEESLRKLEQEDKVFKNSFGEWLYEYSS